MSLSHLRSLLCGAFLIDQEGETLLVRMPFGVAFNDDLVVRIRPDGHAWRVDDNGDTLLALAIAGSAPDAERIAELAPEVEFDANDGSLIVRSETPADIAAAVFAVARAALRVRSACLDCAAVNE